MFCYCNLFVTFIMLSFQEVSLQGHWKFAVFWHVARNVVIQDSGRSSRLGEFRTLDRYIELPALCCQCSTLSCPLDVSAWFAFKHNDDADLIDECLLMCLTI